MLLFESQPNKRDTRVIGTFEINKVHINRIVMIYIQPYVTQQVNIWIIKPYFS